MVQLWKIALVLFLLLPKMWANAAQSEVSSFSIMSLESSFLKVLDSKSPYFEEKKSQYPIWAQFFLKDFLRYDPDTEHSGINLQENCKWKLSNSVTKSLPQEEFNKKLEIFLENCEQKIAKFPNDLLSNTYLSMMLKLNPKDYPYGKIVLFNLNPQLKVKGFLAMKNDGRKRPLIVLRTGIFSNATEFLPERFIFFQLFEQSNFNVLVLESNSGQESVTRNKAFALGGYDEGLQNYNLIKKLRDKNEPISKYISSVHLVGDSFGGHGVLFSSILNQLNKKEIESFLGFCPLVQFEKNYQTLKKTFWQSRGINYWVKQRLKGLEGQFPEVLENNFFDIFYPYMVHHYEGALAYDESIKIPTELKSSLKKYWKLNDFMQFYKSSESPLLFFATNKDPLVNYDDNANFLKNQNFDNLKVVTFKEGFHCSFPGAYHWKPIASIVQSFFYNQFAKEFEIQELFIDLPQAIEKFIIDNGLLIHSQVIGHLNNSGIQIKLVFKTKDTDFALINFLKENILEFPSLEFSFAASNAGYITDQGKDDLIILNRWVQQNLEYQVVNHRLRVQWISLKKIK